MSGSAGQKGGSLREMALTAVAGATGGSSVSVIVGVTNVRATSIVMEKDLILQIETVLAHAN